MQFGGGPYKQLVVTFLSIDTRWKEGVSIYFVINFCQWMKEEQLHEFYTSAVSRLRLGAKIFILVFVGINCVAT